MELRVDFIQKVSSKEGRMWGGKGGIKKGLRVLKGETCSYRYRNKEMSK
jgi:hypothetical protein